MKLIPTLLLAATAVAASAAFAHGDEYLDTQKAPNGGQLRMAGVYHYELVVDKVAKEAKDSPVVVHVTDHAGAKVATAGASGTATILAGKQKASVALVPDGDNRLKGTVKLAATPDMKVVVSVTLPGKAAEQARFTPLAVPKALAAVTDVSMMDHKH